ncbi:hypothetical protein CLOM_g13880 [Closterium sp. NIES-68]|nr:hypothetical protein CLOM_g13880 [Closterium sp. NIES-68]GJP67041.1 hypothetical protein CLOP_g23916 [Closterium sp. NIES-67]
MLLRRLVLIATLLLVSASASPLLSAAAAAAGGASAALSGGGGAAPPVRGAKPVGVAALPAVAQCTRSFLPGYTASATLDPRGIILHWQVYSSSEMDLALEVRSTSNAHKGWIAVGFSKAGKMVGSDAVVGNLAGRSGVGAYALAGAKLAAVKPTRRFRISKISVTSNSRGTIMRFTRTGYAGAVRLKYRGSNTILWAHSASGASKALDYHSPKNRGAVAVNFGCKM